MRLDSSGLPSVRTGEWAPDVGSAMPRLNEPPSALPTEAAAVGMGAVLVSVVVGREAVAASDAGLVWGRAGEVLGRPAGATRPSCAG